VIEPGMCGVGGDLMALVWNAKTQKLTGYNGSGHSPRRLTLDAYRERGFEKIPVRDPITWTVPGCVAGWNDLLHDHGTRELGALLAPAIRLAEEGCAVPPVIAHEWSFAPETACDSFVATYLPGGRAPRAGEVFKNPDLAWTYKRLSEDPHSLYKGEIAERLDGYSRNVGGLLGEEDLAEHAGEWVDPISTTYRDCTVLGLPPNTQGLCVLQMFNMLEMEDLAALGWGSAEVLHRFVEAKKLSFEDRARFVADPRCVDVDTAKLISKEHARQRWRRFDPNLAARCVEEVLPIGTDTTYLCAADAEGNAISLIQSVYNLFGSGFVPDGLGFCMQNRGRGFSLDPDHPCCAAPMKRPLHTIIPGFAMRGGKPWLCFGVMGGTMQPQGQVQILTNMIDFGMDVQAAGEAPRWRHEGSSDVDGTRMTDGGEVRLEAGFSDVAREGLRDRGHEVVLPLDIPGERMGGYQGIEIDQEKGVLRGGSDPRKDGCAMAVEL